MSDKSRGPWQRCADFGGVTGRGKPCRQRVKGKRCHEHDPEYKLIQQHSNLAQNNITAIDVHQVKRLASVLNKAQLADFFGVSETMLRNRFFEHPELAEAYQRGRSQALDDVGKALLKKAKEGNVVSMIFYLKTKGGWRETQAVDLHHSGSLQIDMPAVQRELEDRLAGIHQRLGGGNGGGELPAALVARLSGNGGRDGDNDE